MREIVFINHRSVERYVLKNEHFAIAWIEKVPRLNGWWLLRSPWLYWIDPGARDASKLVKHNFGLPWFLEGYEDNSRTLLIKGRKNALEELERVKDQGDIF